MAWKSFAGEGDGGGCRKKALQNGNRSFDNLLRPLPPRCILFVISPFNCDVPLFSLVHSFGSTLAMTSPADSITPTASGTRISEHTLKLPDGTEMFYRAWLPETPTEKALVIFHRGHEHSGRVQDIVEALNLPDVAVFAWDARGHGKTPGERGYAPDFATMVGDVDCFVRHISETYHKRIEDMAILAQSVGAVTVSAWVHDYAPPIRALVLAAPAFVIKLYVPLAIPGLRMMLKLRKGRKMFVNSYVKAQMLTHDFKQAQKLQRRRTDRPVDRGQYSAGCPRYGAAADRRRRRDPRADAPFGGRLRLGREARPATTIL